MRVLEAVQERGARRWQRAEPSECCCFRLSTDRVPGGAILSFPFVHTG